MVKGYGVFFTTEDTEYHGVLVFLRMELKELGDELLRTMSEKTQCTMWWSFELTMQR